MASELAKIELDLRREKNAAVWALEWYANHIPTIDRLKKVDGKNILLPCPHCEKLKNGQ